MRYYTHLYLTEGLEKKKEKISLRSNHRRMKKKSHRMN